MGTSLHTSERPPVSDDAQAMMMFEANKKSALLAYVLWFFVGTFGGHRLYCDRILTGLVQLLLSGLGWLLIWVFGLGLLFLVPLWIWVLVDALLIPGWINDYNSRLAERLAGR